MKSILVADRSSFIRSLLKRNLYKTDYRIVEEAENGKEALAKFKGCKPDIVLLEFLMPQLNGFETLKEILQFNPTANVIMMSSIKDDCLMNQSRELGAKGFVIKPGFDGLLASLQHLS